MIVKGYLLCYAYLFLVIFGVGAAKKLIGFSIETSRKIIHMLICSIWVFSYYFFWDSWHTIVVPISFVIINALSYKFKLFKMIERDNGDDNHKGTIYFAIGITALVIFAKIWPSTIMSTGIATFALCFGDGPAALFGTLAKNKKYICNGKTVQGTISCFLGAMIGLFLFCVVMSYHIPLWTIIIISVATALLELVGRGFDNFSILFGVYLLCAFFTRIGVFQ